MMVESRREAEAGAFISHEGSGMRRKDEEVWRREGRGGKEIAAQPRSVRSVG